MEVEGAPWRTWKRYRIKARQTKQSMGQSHRKEAQLGQKVLNSITWLCISGLVIVKAKLVKALVSLYLPSIHTTSPKELHSLTPLLAHGQ